MQQCSNFKDPGVQIYTTKKFSLLQDALEEIFVKLPPPKPSLKARCGRSYQQVRSMSRYYNAAAPCFASGGVTLVDGSKKDISELKSGDKVMSGGKVATVSCIVETECYDGIEPLVELDGGVLVTPWHPVRKTGDASSKFVFPASLKEPKFQLCHAVYSFVLDGCTYLEIGEYDGIALGHGIEDDEVAKHDYLGTRKVIDNLKTMPGWKEGSIKLRSRPCVREPTSNLIVGLEQNLN